MLKLYLHQGSTCLKNQDKGHHVKWIIHDNLALFVDIYLDWSYWQNFNSSREKDISVGVGI